MIGALRGTLVRREPPLVLVDVRGVGFEVEVPLSTFDALPAAGAEVTLHTQLIVREDALALFGFATLPERATFRQLLRVAGVGPRLALAVLSGASPAELAALVQAGDLARLTRIPGIGRKTAERIVVELRDALPAIAGAATGAGARTPLAEAEAALAALGYKPQEVVRALAGAPANADSEALVRTALRVLMRS
jgi:holliday junction DNA helicase RuvA